MKRQNQVKRLITQFSYDHKKLDSHLIRVRKSADELNKLLDNMATHKKNEEKS